jgi:hypothetical protein
MIFHVSGIDLRHRIDCIFLIAKCLVNVVKGELRHAGFALRLGSSSWCSWFLRFFSFDNTR